MESTGIYWKPIFNIMEDEFDIVLVIHSPSKLYVGKRPISRIASELLIC
jgi:hypothetical protein